MEVINFNTLENMAEYKDSIKNMSTQKLQAEFDKLTNKLKLNYICAGDKYYVMNEMNIKDKPDEMFRILNRKRISFISAFLSGCFRQFGMDYAYAWSFVNKKFTDSLYVPYYARFPLNGKQIALADKLNNHGCVAYKNFLMLVYDNLSNKGYDLDGATFMALQEERNADSNIDRSRCFTNNFLPKGIGTVHKTILKLDILKSVMKEKTAINEKNAEDELK